MINNSIVIGLIRDLSFVLDVLRRKELFYNVIISVINRRKFNDFKNSSI